MSQGRHKDSDPVSGCRQSSVRPQAHTPRRDETLLSVRTLRRSVTNFRTNVPDYILILPFFVVIGDGLFVILFVITTRTINCRTIFGNRKHRNKTSVLYIFHINVLLMVVDDSTRDRKLKTEGATRRRHYFNYVASIFRT